MPERKTAVKQVEASQVQGDGAWVRVRKALWGENKEVATWPEIADEETAGAIIEAFLAPKLVDWNWVGEDGAPLPPPTTPGVIDLLTREEIVWLIGAVR